ncbi:MAG: hypothetical protein OEZ58_14580 [Gammaproteobacteria bacterium]|nr:hypothetical protein [Gammaproteobacteria bacterium]MDH5730219.1 hypothetical protein [Gammaproteobacteria bacterium]
MNRRKLVQISGCLPAALLFKHTNVIACSPGPLSEWHTPIPESLLREAVARGETFEQFIARVAMSNNSLAKRISQTELKLTVPSILEDAQNVRAYIKLDLDALSTRMSEELYCSRIQVYGYEKEKGIESTIYHIGSYSFTEYVIPEIALSYRFVRFRGRLAAVAELLSVKSNKRIAYAYNISNEIKNTGCMSVVIVSGK